MSKHFIITFLAVLTLGVGQIAAQTPGEKADFEKATKANTIKSYDTYLKNYGNEPRAYKPYVNEIRDRRDWLTAQDKNTEEAYNTYLSNHRNGVFAKEARKRVDKFVQERNENTDNSMWADAQNKNTETAYRYYIDNAPLKLHVSEANTAIREIPVSSEWRPLQNSTDISKLEAFKKKYANTEFKKYANYADERIHAVKMANDLAYINSHPTDTMSMKSFLSAYPDSKDYSQVKGRMHLVEARHFYGKKEYAKALSNYNLAEKHSTLTTEDKVQQREANAQVIYNRSYKNSTDKAALKKFMADYPNTLAAQAASNKVACLMANDFHGKMYSYELSNALSYATNLTTENYVKDKYNDADRRYKREIRNENGGIVNMALGFELGGAIDSELPARVGVNAGVRFGNYTDPVQFEVGVAPSWGISTDEYDSDYGSVDFNSTFYLPAYASLKISKRSGSIYFKATGFYNFKRDEDYTPTYNLRAGFGSAWKHFDWDWLYVQYNPETFYESATVQLGMRFTFYITR